MVFFPENLEYLSIERYSLVFTRIWSANHFTNSRAPWWNTVAFNYLSTRVTETCSEDEKSVLSKGLTFVPVKKSSDEYRVKADWEKFYRRLRLRVHFHNEEASEPQATPDTSDPFAMLNNKESTWTPPEGKFTATDHYVDRCRCAVNALDFKTRTHQNNLPPSEKQALLHLTKRDDIIKL